MAKQPQTPLDEELERAEQDAEPQEAPLEGDLEEALEVAATEQELVDGFSADNGDNVDVLRAHIEELEQSVADAKDQALRAAAEAQNVRRRAEQEADKARKFALEKFIKELLPVIDSLEKALETMQEGTEEAHREGVSMTLKLKLDVLGKFGVEVVDPHGEPFDPQYHEAMAMVPNPELEPSTVMEVIQKGYLLNGRLVRPAMVVVSQAAS